eukprot:4191728-Pyramimonas_sp.AAC.1
MKSAEAHPDGRTAGNGRGTGTARIHGWLKPDFKSKETAAWGLIGIEGPACTWASTRWLDPRKKSITRQAGAHVPTCGAHTEHGRKSKIPASCNSCGVALKSPPMMNGLPMHRTRSEMPSRRLTLSGDIPCPACK